MAATIRTLCCSVLRHSNRQLSTTCRVQAGEKWRKEHGLARSGTEYGPLTDLPDWSFADGRPAPPLKGMLRRKQEREVLARRIVMLSSEVDRGMETWREKQEEVKRAEEHKKSLLLKPKGKLLRKKNP
ncbi:39S ribosomal protein L52, mitochondrial [Scomber japonicus]|uniref:39S ribosomal protein L52, mitochondrial n=1 Tax=Scomber japonicus TaxID=13676 RepID=UPI00230575C6|nr:39S ribosomal protein L52, mitochondrial [Scomber japonicus]